MNIHTRWFWTSGYFQRAKSKRVSICPYARILQLGDTSDTSWPLAPTCEERELVLQGDNLLWSPVGGCLSFEQLGIGTPHPRHFLPCYRRPLERTSWRQRAPGAHSRAQCPRPWTLWGHRPGFLDRHALKSRAGIPTHHLLQSLAVRRRREKPLGQSLMHTRQGFLVNYASLGGEASRTNQGVSGCGKAGVALGPRNSQICTLQKCDAGCRGRKGLGGWVGRV